MCAVSQKSQNFPGEQSVRQFEIKQGNNIHFLCILRNERYIDGHKATEHEKGGNKKSGEKRGGGNNDYDDDCVSTS